MHISPCQCAACRFFARQDVTGDDFEYQVHALDPFDYVHLSLGCPVIDKMYCIEYGLCVQIRERTDKAAHIPDGVHTPCWRTWSSVHGCGWPICSKGLLP